MSAAWSGAAKAFRRAAELRRFLRSGVQPEELEGIVARRLAEREANFLTLVRDAILASPSNPMGRLMRIASVTYADVEDSVARHGIEATLTTLRRAGVYLALDELKGWRPLVRGGQEIPFRLADLYRSSGDGRFEVASGGSSGRAAQVRLSFGYLELHTVNLALSFEVAAGLRTPTILWLPVYPSAAGLLNSLMLSRVGAPPWRWFAQTRTTTAASALTNRATLALARSFGHPLQPPEEAPADSPGPVLEAALEALSRHGRCLLQTYVSSAVRLCRAALQRGARLDGLTIVCASEPITAPRRAAMEASGARVVPLYWITEVGLVGCACPDGCPGTDEVHVWRDALAVIGGGEEGESADDALYFTPLLAAFPTAWLNLEVGDRGRIHTRPCGCVLGRLGLEQRLDGIHSVQRLTIEGVTIAAAELVDLVERVLPERHGGAPGDYQVVEQWSAGVAHALVRVSPRLGALDEGAVRSTVLDALARSHSVQGRLLAQTGAFEVERQEPHATEAGKILPIAVLADPHRS